MNKTNASSILFALLAAILFGASAPLIKLLTVNLNTIVLAGLLYLGSGTIMLAAKGLQSIHILPVEKEEKWGKREIPYLMGAILAGGVAAPILLLFSLKTTPAATASLLLNFEVAATTLIAVWLFKEKITSQVVLAILFITTASILLSLDSAGGWGFALGAVGIIGACFLWGFDNNFTKMISAKDAITIVLIKGLSAGTFSFLLSQLIGESLPTLQQAVVAMAVGAVCYGVSIFFFVLAIRKLGAARTSTLFGAAPFAGVLVSMLLFHDPINLRFILSAGFILAGITLLTLENQEPAPSQHQRAHIHFHRHDDGQHDHFHLNPNRIFPLHIHHHRHPAEQDAQKEIEK